MAKDCVRADLVQETFDHFYRDRLKNWSLGCMKRATVAGGGWDAGITQPMDHYFANPCNVARFCEWPITEIPHYFRPPTRAAICVHPPTRWGQSCRPERGEEGG